MTNTKYIKTLDNLDIKYYDIKSAVNDIKENSFETLNHIQRR